MPILFAVVYMLAGILLAIPYCLLAGWDADKFMLVAFVLPAFLFVGFLLAAFVNIIEPGYRRAIQFNWRAAFGKTSRPMLPGSLFVFWVWVIYSFLPVIIHGSALLLEEFGYKAFAALIDAHRYPSIYYVFIVTIVLLILTGIVAVTWGAVKNAWMRR